MTDDPREICYTPQFDISAYELALVMNVLLCPIAGRGPLEAYDELPPEAQRHFTLLEPPVISQSAPN